MVPLSLSPFGKSYRHHHNKMRVLNMEIKQDGLLIMHGHLAPTTITYQIASGKSDLGTVARALSMIIPLRL